MKTQLKIILRGLLKNKKFLFFSISGLIVSFTFFLLLFAYVRTELTYDTQIPGHENIYRVITKVTSNGNTVKETAKSQMPLGEALKDKIPGVVSYARILDEENLYRNGEVKLNRQKTYWVDESFPEMFSLQIVEGNATDALSKPYCGLVSEEVARTFFGNKSPLGKILILNEGLNMEIKGVFRKPEYKSHFDFDYLMSFKTVLVYNQFQNNWDTDGYYTYIQMSPTTDIGETNGKLAQFAASTYVNYPPKNQQVELKLQRVASIHLNSHLENELGPNSRFSFIVILASLGLITLLVSWLNFTGMVLSRYMANHTSLLMNRIFGSSHNLLGTVALEIFILISTSVVFSILFTTLYGNRLFSLLELPIFVYPLHLVPVLTGALLLSGVVFCSTVAGAVLFGKLPKGCRLGVGSSGKLDRQQSSLVVLQYSFSIFLIIFLAIAYKQIHFLKSSDPGYSKDHVLAVHTPRTLIMNPERITKGNLFIGELTRNGYAQAGSITSDLPGKLVHTDLGGFFWLSPPQSPDLKVPADWVSIDHGYFKTLGLKLVAGRDFETEIERDENKIIINEKAAKAMGFDSPEKAIGSLINGNSVAVNSGNKTFSILGVVSDFHQEGLQQEIKPMAFTHSYFYLFGCCAVKLTNAGAENVGAVKKVWESVFPNDPFDYFFLDERFNQQYQNEVLFFRLCLVFGIIATLIACYGLFGISVETILKRRKEIGIRRVNGATIFEIMRMLNLSFIKWTIISFLIASPFAYFAIHKWLESFAYRTELSWWAFALAGLLALGIALLTVSWQSWKAATRNPVEALRNE